MSLSKRSVSEWVTCRYRVPERTPTGGFIGGVIFEDAAERVWVRVDAKESPSTIHLGGDAEALRAFGEMLVALSSYGSDDPDYHEHFDEAGLIVHGPRVDDRRTTDAEMKVEVEIVYLDDERTGQFDASGVATPSFENELRVGAFFDDGDVQTHLGGSRRALLALGAYLIGLSRITTAGYYDTLYAPGRYGDAPKCQLLLHGPSR